MLLMILYLRLKWELLLGARHWKTRHFLSSRKKNSRLCYIIKKPSHTAREPRTVSRDSGAFFKVLQLFLGVWYDGTRKELIEMKGTVHV